MATNQHRSAAFLGVLSAGATGATAFSLNGAASGGFSQNWLAFAWNPSESKTLSAIKVFCNSVTGVLAGTDLVCDVYSDTAGTGPNASLATSSTVTATPTGAAPVEFTGFSLALTAGTQYWIVLRNANAAPTTKFPTYIYGSVNSFIGAGSGEGNGKWGSGGVLTSVNSGGAWSTSVSGYSFGWRLQYSDGTYDGLPFSNSTGLSGSNAVFGKQAIGVQFVTPPSGVLNVRGATMLFNKSGSPGPAVYKLYGGTTLLATSSQLPAANVTNVRQYPLFFPSTVAVQPGTTLNLLLCDTTTADTNSNTYTQTTFPVDNDANSFSLMPFEGTLRKVLTTDYTAGTPTFSTDQKAIIPFALILDSTGEFGPSPAAILAA